MIPPFSNRNLCLFWLQITVIKWSENYNWEIEVSEKPPLTTGSANEFTKSVDYEVRVYTCVVSDRTLVWWTDFNNSFYVYNRYFPNELQKRFYHPIVKHYEKKAENYIIYCLK